MEVRDTAENVLVGKWEAVIVLYVGVVLGSCDIRLSLRIVPESSPQYSDADHHLVLLAVCFSLYLPQWTPAATPEARRLAPSHR